MGKLRNLAGAILIGLGSLGLFNQSYSQSKRVTELSSWPIKGIKDARYSQGGFVFRTNNDGYIDFLTNVENEKNLEIKLSNLSFNNNVSFNNLGNKANLTIYNVLGQEVKEVNGENYLTWDLTNNFGQRVAFGSYLYKLEDENKIETGKLIPFVNSYGRGSFVLKNKSKVNAPSSSLGNLGKNSVVQVVDTIYCDGRPSTRNLERIMSEFLSSKLSKSNGQIIYSVDKDSNFYSVQDTVESLDKIPSNIQILENVDLGKSDGIGFKEYIDMLRPFGVINFGDFETNYPVSVFLDSAAIYRNPVIGTKASIFLGTLREIIKEAKDSLGLNLLKEVNNINEAKITMDYSSFSHVLSYYSRDMITGNWGTDSLRVYVDPQLANDIKILKVEARHEVVGHMHAPFHSPYSEDITNTSTYQGKMYSFADKKMLRALALAKPGTYWKKFIKR